MPRQIGRERQGANPNGDSSRRPPPCAESRLIGHLLWMLSARHSISVWTDKPACRRRDKVGCVLRPGPLDSPQRALGRLLSAARESAPTRLVRSQPLRLAEQLGPGATVVTIMVDTGMKYLKTYGARLS